MTDAEKFQEALQLLVAAVRETLESGEMDDSFVRDQLQDAFDRYCNVVVELHGSGEDE